MDLEEWELLPNDGFLEIHDDGGKKIFSRKYASVSESKNLLNMDYFICPPSKLSQFVDSTDHHPIVVPNNQLVPIPNPRIQETPDDDDYEVTKEVIITTKVPFEINMLPPPSDQKDQDQVSQVFFKKMSENEFENMKMDSPKSCNKTLLPQIEADDPFRFEEEQKTEVVDKEMVIKKIDMEAEVEENNGGLNLLNWSLNGIGAICSFGVAAAATICIIFIGNSQKHKQNQKIRLQIFCDDKRIKQVVRHANKLDEAISAVRGVAITRAHITVGGYYDAL